MSPTVRAMPAALLLGAGATGWALAVAHWRAAVVGTLDLPADELLLAAAAAGLGAILGASLRLPGRSLLLAGASLVLAAGAGLLAVAWLPPQLAASPVGGLPTLALPLLVVGFVVAALVRHLQGRGLDALAFAAVGGGAAVQLHAAGPSASGFALLAAAAMLLVLAGALLPTRPQAPLANAWAGYCSGGLLLGAFAAALAGRGVASPGTGASPAAALAVAFAVALWCTGRLPRQHRARAFVAAALALALWPGDAERLGVLGFAAMAPAAAAGALLAASLTAARPPALPWLLAATALGAALAAMLMAMGAGADVVLAGAAAGAIAARLRATTTAFAGVAVALTLVGVRAFAGDRAAIDPVGTTVLGRAGTAAALYRAPAQEVALAVAGRDLDVAGPERDHAAVLAALAAAFAPRGELVVIGSGTGRIREALGDLPRAAAFVEPCPAALALRGELAADGPVPSRRAPGPAPAWLAGSREFALLVDAGSCAAIACGEPLLAPQCVRASVEEHLALRRAAGAGAVLQGFLLERTPPAVLRAALGAAAAAHPFCGVLWTGSTGVVCGLGGPPDLDAVWARIERMPEAMRWRLHAAGLASADDLRAAWLGEVAPGDAVVGDDDLVGGRRDGAGAAPAAIARANAAVLAAAVLGAARGDSIASARLAVRAAEPAALAGSPPMERLLAAARAMPGAVLVRRDLQAAAVRAAEAAIAAADPGQPREVADAAAVAVRFAHVGCPSPVLQAALALPDRKGEAVRRAPTAGAAALALDPGFAAAAPPVLRPVFAGVPQRSPLADFAQLPEPARLAELASGDTTLAIALRVRFPSRCAAALVEAWAAAPLPTAGLAALRELADPFVLERAARALAGRGAAGELLQVWRRDLPATAAVALLWAGDAGLREALQIGLAGRTDPTSLHLLGCGLVDPELAVRTAAGAALFRSVGGRVGYDPEWSPERRQQAAAELAALNPQTPR